MKIHSKFKDYYDTVSAYGHDEKCHYVRKEEDHFIERDKFEVLGHMPDPPYGFDLHRHVIGFCGKIYPVYIASYYENHGCSHRQEFLYTAKQVHDYVKRTQKKKTYEWFMEKDQRQKFRMRRTLGFWTRSFANEEIEAFFEHYSGSTEYDWVFDEYKVPLFVLNIRSRSDYEIVINSKLRDFGFAQIRDPYQAYQDIYQFITMRFGVGEPETLEISDEDMRDAKGFDNWSFKKLKTKPKGKRRKNHGSR